MVCRTLWCDCIQPAPCAACFLLPLFSDAFGKVWIQDPFVLVMWGLWKEDSSHGISQTCSWFLGSGTAVRNSRLWTASTWVSLTTEPLQFFLSASGGVLSRYSPCPHPREPVALRKRENSAGLLRSTQSPITVPSATGLRTPRLRYDEAPGISLWDPYRRSARRHTARQKCRAELLLPPD